MNLPTKELPGPRNWSFRECEKVVQEDGQIGVFFFDSLKPLDGWVFDRLEDKWGFISLTGDEQVGVIARRLLDNECDSDRKLVRTGRHYLRPDQDIITPVKPVSAEEMERRWSKFAMPIIKNVVQGESILESLLSVQPMTGPIDGPTFPIRIITAEESQAEKVSEIDHFSQALKEGEVLKQYAYGGVLSGRGGYFIVHGDRLDRVLRYQQTWLS